MNDECEVCEHCDGSALEAPSVGPYGQLRRRECVYCSGAGLIFTGPDADREYEKFMDSADAT